MIFSSFYKKISVFSFVFFTICWADTPNFCKNQIHFEEKSKGIEAGLLEAIATIESKLNPYVVNVQGVGYQFRNLEMAVDFAQSKLNRGIRNISVGPMQLHVPSHRRHFKTLKDMIEPVQNIRYAASFFSRLKRQYGSCEKAVRYYHSANPTANRRYKNLVFGAWARIKKKGPPSIPKKNQLISGSKTGALTPIQQESLNIVKAAYRLHESLQLLKISSFIAHFQSSAFSFFDKNNMNHL